MEQAVMSALRENYERVSTTISQAAKRAGRDLRAIELVAVSKGASDDVLAAAIELGMHDFGENRVTNLVRRAKHFSDQRWHMIGQLQSNKVKELMGHSHLIHSLDRWSLAEEIERHSARQGIITSALIEVNIAEEPQKAGIVLSDLSEFIDSLGDLPHLQVCGLMCMAPLSEVAEESRPVFRLLAERFQYYRQHGPRFIRMDCLSMGMSLDYEIAVEEGATLVRVGSALFDL